MSKMVACALDAPCRRKSSRNIECFLEMLSSQQLVPTTVTALGVVELRLSRVAHGLLIFWVPIFFRGPGFFAVI